jgi:3-hydroxyisobutyrate dehydrogenase-like beta-hydroxyacid dehydrogenase
MTAVIENDGGHLVNFGTIGAGTIAQALARHLMTAGHRVMLSKVATSQVHSARH